MVGGSTRTPLVERRLRDEFRREPSRAVDPDLAVALGAAVQAAMIEGRSVGPVLVDVTGHTLGIEAVEGMPFFGSNLMFSPIIHRNTPLPARYEQAFSTMHENQERAEIHVLQGEHPEPHRNRSIGKFVLDLQTGPDRDKIVIRFDLNLDGALTVTATQSATGIRKKLTIDNALSQFQTEERARVEARLESMFDASDEMLGDDDLAPALPTSRRIDARQPVPGDPKMFADAGAMLVRAAELKATVEGDDAEDIEQLSNRLKEAMASGDEMLMVQICEELDDILFYVD